MEIFIRDTLDEVGSLSRTGSFPKNKVLRKKALKTKIREIQTEVYYDRNSFDSLKPNFIEMENIDLNFLEKIVVAYSLNQADDYKQLSEHNIMFCLPQEYEINRIIEYYMKQC